MLVNAHAFFIPGARYCLFLFKHTRSRTPNPRVAKAMNDYGAMLAKAVRRGKDLRKAVDATVTRFLRGTFCGDTGTSGQLPACSAEGETRIPVQTGAWPGIEKRFKASGHDSIYKLVRRRHEFALLANCWPKPSRTAGATMQATDPTGQLALELAALEGHVTRVGSGYRTNDGTLEIAEVETIRDTKTGRITDLRVFDAGRKNDVVLGVSPNTLFLSDSRTTLEDVLLLTENRMLDGDRAVSIPTVLDGLGDQGWANNPRASQDFAPLVTTLEALARRPHSGLAANDNRKLAARIGRHLAKWDVTVAPDHLADVCPSAPSAPAIPTNVKGRGVIPLHAYLATAVAEYADARTRWLELRDSKFVDVIAVELHGVFPIALEGYTQERFVADYVTPVQGFAGIVPDTTDADPFFLPYAAVQIYFAANPVERPMWARGGLDAGRLVALEVGVAERADSMGPQGRFRGFSGGRFPPVLTGIALQPIPWLTFSMGVAFLERRRAEVGAATYDNVVRFYFSGTVQANIPGIARALGRGRDTKSTD